MFRKSEEIESVGSDFLLDLMCCEKPIYVVKQGKHEWKTAKSKIAAVMIEKVLVVPYDLDYGQVINRNYGQPFMCICYNWVDIKNLDIDWFISEEESLYEALTRNEKEREAE